MFEKWTRKMADKSTTAVAESMKKSFNDRIDQYGDIIQIGLVLAVTIIGGNMISGHTRHRKVRNDDFYSERYIPAALPGGPTPIVINNFYREREREDYYGRQNQYRQPNREQRLPAGTGRTGAPAQKTYPNGQNRR